MVVSLDANRDPQLAGAPKALAVWHALSVAIPELDKLVIAALDAEAAEPERVSVGAAAVEEPEGPDLKRLQATGWITREEAAEMRQRPKLPPPPMSPSGIPYVDSRGLAWKARRDAARAAGRLAEFSDKPPYQWVFGGLG
jgi:hypothetical protein